MKSTYQTVSLETPPAGNPDKPKEPSPKKAREEHDGFNWTQYLELEPVGSLESLLFAVAVLLVMANLSFSFLLNPFFLKVLSEAIAYGRNGNPPFNMPSVETFKKNVLEGVLFAREEKHILDLHLVDSNMYGVTMALDGRRNSKRQALEVCILVTVVGSLVFTSGFPAGGVSKDTVWYVDFMSSCLRPDHSPFADIAKNVVAVATDGAKASIAAVKELCQKESLLQILCMLHATSRTMLHLFQRVESFKIFFAQVKMVLSAFRDIGWLESLLKSVGGLALWRFVDTRMLYIPVVVSRIDRLKGAFEVFSFSLFFFSSFSLLFLTFSAGGYSQPKVQTAN
jgi:hypothetical protein